MNESLAGLVVCSHGLKVEVEDARGRLFHCTSRKKIEPLVCGDRVRWQPTHGDEGVIVHCEPRQTVLLRPDHRGALKAVAANVDRIIIVAAPLVKADAPDGAPHEIDDSLIDRYLVAAELSGMEAVIVINKTDVLNEAALAALRERLALYPPLGYPVIHTSAKFARGLDELAALLKDKTCVIAGQSGVGKSSLAQALLPEHDIRVAEVSTTGKGRHTTSAASLYHLPRGGHLIDSPGVREFHLWHVAPRDVARGFRDIQAHAAHCRFLDCLHLREPRCAVRDALARGELSARRYESYRRIQQSLEEGA